jgi:deoxyribodipyrimidine photolyase-related protein
VLVLAAMRHWAEERRADGWQVEIVRAADWLAGLRDHLDRHGSERVVTMAAAEWATRQRQQTLGGELGLPVDVLPNTQFLIGQHDPIPASSAGKRVVMETFYRGMRTHFGLLLTADGEPEGGRWNLDADNRKPLPKGYVAPRARTFPPDAITAAAINEVDARPAGYGRAAGFDLPVTRTDALAALDDFITHRLPRFGDYEDAMSSSDALLHHSLLSVPLNIGLLEPLEVARAAEAAYHAGHAPLNSVEGFIRQIVGWREFVAWQYWRLMPGLHDANAWDAHRDLPAWFWTGETDLRCLGTVIGRVLADGYSHHIERLMVVCTWCLMAGIDPRQVNDWFLATYVDAYDWVVTPNVVGMGLNADGGIIATKPYVASANYIDKMSDYCRGCRYDRKARTGPNACPYNTLYWNFLVTHEARLKANPRLGPAVLGLSRLDADERAAVTDAAARYLDTLR